MDDKFEEFQANEEKVLEIEVDGIKYNRIPIKTHVITDADKIEDVALKYVGELVNSDDIFFVSEKAVACTQKRAIKLSEIKPRPLAKFLSKFVLRTPYGIGLAMPETMEMALRECGTIRILFAAFISAIGKIFKKRGWFYKIAGYKARSIDGPCDYTIPPYNEYVVLAPDKPDETAKRISDVLGCKAAIVDMNDLEGDILGVSQADMDKVWLVRVLKDNPLGQGSEQTPMGIIRKLEDLN
jgi:F420-0:gamma-glutamyl ligase